MAMEGADPAAAYTLSPFSCGTCAVQSAMQARRCLLAGVGPVLKKVGTEGLEDDSLGGVHGEAGPADFCQSFDRTAVELASAENERKKGLEKQEAA